MKERDFSKVRSGGKRAISLDKLCPNEKLISQLL